MHSIILAVKNDPILLTHAREILADIDDDAAIRAFRDWLDTIAEVIQSEHPMSFSLFMPVISSAIQNIPEQEILALRG